MNEAKGDSKRNVASWFKTHWQMLLNVYLFINIGGWVAWRTYETWARGAMGYVEAAFTIQSVIFLVLIMSRRPHRAVDRNVFHQAIALVAFFSGLAFLGQTSTGGAGVQTASRAVILVAHVLGALCLLNLGRSFGILIALRDIKTQGVYGLVRHPMYVTDILLRVGFIISHLNWLTSTLVVISSACYVYRAILEENFLAQQPEYREYMKEVKYRFVPFVV